MASALLAGRQVPACLVPQRRSGRTSAFRSRPAPFTPARRVFVRAQEPEESVAVSDEELAQLVEEDGEAEEVMVVEDAAGEDAEYDASEGVLELGDLADVAVDLGFKDPADEGEEFVLDDNDEDLLAGLEAAELLALDVDGETVAAVGAELDETEEGEEVAEYKAALETILAAKLDREDANEEELAAITDLVADDEELGEIELENYVPPSNADRYAEVALSAEDKEAIEPLKLSKSELRNLLPQDWDQINTDFFSNKKDEAIPLPEFRINVLWKENLYLGVAIDQVYARGQVSPLTEYYFWPRQDAWEDLRINLEGRPWISERDRIVLLNRLTELINYWQDEQVKHTVEEARLKFPDCAFTAA